MEAKYNEKDLEEFIGNPYIAALPPDFDPLASAARLVTVPPYAEGFRTQGKQQRLDRLPRIANIHIPSRNDTDIALNFERCLHWGYVSRNPMSFDVVKQALEEEGVNVDSALEHYLKGYLAPAYGFPILGISGVGKTCSILNVASHYDQVIHHTQYRGISFIRTQLVWLRVECPGDGTPKGLCSAIFQAIDEVLGTTHYATEYMGNRISKDLLTLRAGSLMRTLGLGVLIIDDIQNLCGTKTSVSKELLSFLINLIESLKVPVIMVGTPKILEILQSEFQQAKRATGEGAINMELLSKGSDEWRRLIRSIWNFQFTRTEVKLTAEMEQVFYEQSVGNPFLLAILYKLVQDDAILSEREFFTVADVKKVADLKLGITATMRTNMLNGRDEELNRYKAYWQTASANMVINAGTSGTTNRTSETKQDLEIKRLKAKLLEELTKALIEENLGDKEINRLANMAIYGKPNSKDLQELVVYALSLHAAERETQSGTASSGGLLGLGKTDEIDYEDLKKGGFVDNNDAPFRP